MMEMTDNKEILLIHLGGLGDMCISESTFFSLYLHFGNDMVALGYTRFLRLFEGYFKRIERIESAKWLPLFSQYTPDIAWKRIVFIGNDREGALREKWGRMSKEPMIFIKMYPEDQGSRIKEQGSGFNGFAIRNVPPLSGLNLTQSAMKCHVEDFQLMQLGQYGIEAVKKEIEANLARRVILYPEKGFKKEKWHYDNFIDLYKSLKSKGVDVCILKSMGLETGMEEAAFFEELIDVRGFFKPGGILLSNDSGMAHLAGMCGLFTITIFKDFDPDVWHPRGRGTWLQAGKDIIDVSSIESRIMEAYRRAKP